MNFKNQLEEFKKYKNLSLCDVVVATEVDDIFANDLNDEEYEKICSYIKEIFLRYEYSVNELTNLIKNILDDGVFENVEELIQQPYRIIVEYFEEY